MPRFVVHPLKLVALSHDRTTAYDLPGPNARPVLSAMLIAMIGLVNQPNQ